MLESSAAKSSFKAEFARRRFLVRANLNSSPLGVDLENEDELRGARPHFMRVSSKPSFPETFEKPRLRHNKKRGRLPRDIDDYRGYWLVSAKMKTLLETVDHEAFIFLRCDLLMSDGSPGPEVWLCDVIRTLDALDEGASNLRIVLNREHKQYALIGDYNLVFQDSIVRDACVFRIENAPSKIICDERLRTACKAADIKNISFRNTSTVGAKWGK